MFWMVKPVEVSNQSLLFEHDDALYSAYMTRIGEKLLALWEGRIENFRLRPDRELVESLLDIVVEADALVRTEIIQYVKTLPDNHFRDLSFLAISRVGDDFIRLFNHLVLFNRVLATAAQIPEKSATNSWHERQRVFLEERRTDKEALAATAASRYLKTLATPTGLREPKGESRRWATGQPPVSPVVYSLENLRESSDVLVVRPP